MRFRSAFAVVVPVVMVTVVGLLMTAFVFSSKISRKNESRNSLASAVSVSKDSQTNSVGGNVLGCSASGGTQTCSYTIGSIWDDGKYIPEGSQFQHDVTDDPVGHPFNKDETRSAYLHYTGVSIPAGAIIDSATVKFTARDDALDGDDYANRQAPSTIKTKFFAQKVVDAPQITSFNNYTSSMSQPTTAVVGWDNIPLWYPNPSNPSDLTSPDLKTVISELVGQVGWGTGAHAINILWRDNGTATTPCCSSNGIGGPGRVPVSYDGQLAGLGTAPILTITWHLPVPTGLTMSPLPVCSNSNYGGSLVVFNWTASNGAGSYEVDVSQNSSFTTYAKKTITGSPPATTMTGTNTPTWSNVGAPSPALFDGSGLSLVPGTSYYWRVIAIDANGNQSAPAVPAPASFSVPLCPQVPTGLIVTHPACTSATQYGSIQVTFNWTASAGATSYRVDLSADSNFGSYVQKTAVAPPIDGSSSGGDWTGNSQHIQLLWGNLLMDRGTPFYWRVTAINAYGSSAPAVYIDAGSVPLNSFSVPDCNRYDLVITAVGAVKDSGCLVDKPSAVFSAGETLCQNITVTNLGTSNYAAPAGLKLGTWTTGAPGSLPNCTTTPKGQATTSVTFADLPAIAIGATTPTIQVTFAVGNFTDSPTAGIYVDPLCSSGTIETGWSSNKYTFTYRVNVNGWFNTTGGDVGAGNESNYGDISVGITGKNVSDYLVASSTIGQTDLYGAGSRAWQIQYGASAYGSLVPRGGIYDYFNQKFRVAAQASANNCSAGASGNFAAGFTICNGSLTMTGSTAIVAPTVVFVDGNLNINANYAQAGSSATVVFIVSGSVNIASNVTTADGVYIVKGTYSTGYGGTCLQTAGAVYANVLNLQRTATSDASCSGGSTAAAETFAFDPKYTLLMNQLLGISSTSWQEIAP